MADSAKNNSDWLDSELYCPFQHEQALLYEHAESVAARAFLKMVNLPFTLEQRPNAEFMSPNGLVPFLRVQSTLVGGFLDIVDFVAQKVSEVTRIKIRVQGVKLTNTLSEAELADMQALIALVYENLLNVEKFFCWKDPANYHSVTKLRYGSAYPVPLKWLLPFLKRREMNVAMDEADMCSKSVEDVVHKADSCFHALSVKLAHNTYLMGSEPTELDALAFGHLFSILTTELPSMHLANALRKHSNLIKYCCDIDKNYFKL